MIFAACRNGSIYYGAFRNVTLQPPKADNALANITDFNMTAYALQGSNVTIYAPNVTSSGAVHQVASTMMTFNLTNGNVSPRYAHVEVEVNYTPQTLKDNRLILTFPPHLLLVGSNLWNPDHYLTVHL